MEEEIMGYTADSGDSSELIRSMADEILGYPFFPIILMGFFRAVSLTLLGLGLPNYFLFDLHSTGFAAGLSNFMYCIPYSILPFYSGKISDRWGRKKGIALSVIGINLVFPLLLMDFDIFTGLFVRFMEGLFTAFFWPVLQALISDTKEIVVFFSGESATLRKKIGRYNTGWNLGGLTGFLLGAVFVFVFNNNKIVFVINWIVSLMLIPLIFFIKIPEPEKLRKVSSYIAEKLAESSENSDVTHELAFSHKVKIIYPTVLILVAGMIMSGVSLLTSVKFKAVGLPAFLTYLLSFIRSVSMASFSNLTSKMTAGNYIIKGLISGVVLSFIPIFMGLTVNLPFYTVLFGILGFTYIYYYTLSLKLLIDKNAAEKTAKYTGVFEALIGMAFGFTPFFLGIWADDYYNIEFIMIGIIGIIAVILNSVTAGKDRKIR